MDDIFLYFLGAGASCNVLPLTSNFTERLHSFANDLQNIGPRNIYDEPDKSKWDEPLMAFHQAIVWLANETAKHASVDTFAKKLFFLKDFQKLKKLKAVLSSYLIIEQALKYVDTRYDSFFATILNTDTDGVVSIPPEFRIITWNYDTQLEKAFYGFCENEKYVIENITFNDHIYRINGYCGSNPPGRVGDAFKSIWNPSHKSVWNSGIELFNNCMSSPESPEPGIRFAWEQSTRDRIAKKAIDLSKISTVVVIGYSFPYFNREIDYSIFSSLSDGVLRRIYLQYPDGSHVTVENRLRSLLPREVDITRITEIDMFYIPDEFWVFNNSH
jgi:hypothetical protein